MGVLLVIFVSFDTVALFVFIIVGIFSGWLTTCISDLGGFLGDFLVL